MCVGNSERKERYLLASFEIMEGLGEGFVVKILLPLKCVRVSLSWHCFM